MHVAGFACYLSARLRRHPYPALVQTPLSIVPSGLSPLEKAAILRFPVRPGRFRLVVSRFCRRWPGTISAAAFRSRSDHSLPPQKPRRRAERHLLGVLDVSE